VTWRDIHPTGPPEKGNLGLRLIFPRTSCAQVTYLVDNTAHLGPDMTRRWKYVLPTAPALSPFRPNEVRGLWRKPGADIRPLYD
jgi:hypothetical protein